jgi:hypothetical protein
MNALLNDVMSAPSSSTVIKWQNAATADAGRGAGYCSFRQKS